MRERELSELVDRFKLHQRRLPPIYDHASTWYEPWYFELRLTEEVSRAERYGVELALVYAVIEEPEGLLSPERQLLMNALANVAATGLRDTDIPGLVLEGRYAVCLPHTDERGAQVVLERLRGSLAHFRPSAGLTVYPEGGTDGGALLASGLGEALRAAESAA